ncbi:MAG: DUF2924 domain-containing protein [Erythrobacter sp.]|uniref:DUF2924 domain-containing protein n=1 Tax=Erythrobacter sp. TaxID=1042 RepID=UPI003C762D87
MSTMAEEIAQIEELGPALVRARWEALFRKDVPPRSVHLLRLQIAWRLQERQGGRLSRATRRELRNAAFGKPSIAAGATLAVGTRLLREWNGRRIEVLVLEDGYRFESRTYRSLSQIARHVTGARWSGPRFFGLTPKRSK